MCFGGENKSVTVSPSKITPNVGEKWNPEMRIEPAEPKRRRCQPRNEENISIAPDSRTPTWLFCHVCNKNVCIYIYPTTEYMQVLLSHVGKHMALIYSKVSNTPTPMHELRLQIFFRNFHFEFLNTLKSTSRCCKMNL